MLQKKKKKIFLEMLRLVLLLLHFHVLLSGSPQRVFVTYKLSISASNVLAMQYFVFPSIIIVIIITLTTSATGPQPKLSLLYAVGEVTQRTQFVVSPRTQPQIPVVVYC
jgi:hypothetical protein